MSAATTLTGTAVSVGSAGVVGEGAARAVLARLREKRIRVWAEDGGLKYRAPQGALDPDLRAALAAAKEEILALLAESGGLPPLAKVPRTGPLPLSFAQQRLWFLDRFEADPTVYNTPAIIPMPGEIDARHLQWALDRLIERHESLRTCFREDPATGEPFQAVLPAVETPIARADLSGLPADARATEAAALAGKEAARPFDLASGPLLRATLLRLSPEEHHLVLVMHHIVTDGWSMDILAREMRALYLARAAGRDAALPSLEFQYPDVAAWQRGLEGTLAWKAQLDWWTRKLAGAEGAELPADFPRPRVRTNQGAVERFLLPTPLAEACRALARVEGASLFMVLLTAWSAFLARLSGKEDICVGSPIANRNRSGAEGVVGFFVNTLVFRMAMDPSMTFRDLLRRAKRECLDAYDRQDIPFEKIVEAAAPPRDLSRTPFFQTLLVLQNTPGDAQWASAAGEPVRIPARASKFDTTLSLVETAFGLEAEWEYSVDLFTRPTVERLFASFRGLLEDAVTRPGAEVRTLVLLDPPARGRLDAWNGTAVDYGPARLVHEAFEERVRIAPDAMALLFEGGGMTYGELNRAANRLARRLRALGAGPEERVGLCLDRSPHMVISLWAAIKCGAAYVPLDPAQPRERLLAMARSSGARAILCEPRRMPDLEGLGAPLLDPALATDPAGEEDDGDLGVSMDLDNPCYVIFTSGSTGAPKGVANSHRAIWNRLEWMRREYGVTAADTLIQKTNYAFDVSVWEFLLPMLIGARLVIPAPGGHLDNAYMATLMEEREVTLAHFVPSMLRLYLEDPTAGRARSLTRVVCSGESLDAAAIARFQQVLPRCALHNLYGPTEAAVDVTYWPCAREPERPGLVPIGFPIANIRLYVVDANLERLPAGVPGELCLAGVGLARGYLGRPGLTAERFVPDPFSGDGGRMYRTGDLARHLSDGSVEYLGRMDFQVKIRGLRIELGEIEAAFDGIEGVGHRAVIARGDAGDLALAAYWVAEGPEAPDTAALRNRLRDRLPEYMVPATFTRLESMPFSANGKLDRKRLPAPEAEVPAEGFAEAATRMEADIGAVWGQALGLSRVPVDRNFFDLGGHSLLMVRVHQLLRARLGRETSLVKLFQYPTVRDLAAHLEAPEAAGAGERVPDLAGMSEGRALLERMRDRRTALGSAR